jgi:hypothetical protein
MAAHRGIAATVGSIKERATNLVRLQIELARAELREKGRTIGVAAGMLVGAAVLAFFAAGLLIALITVALAIVLPDWLAVLIVLLLVAGTAAGLAALGARRIKHAGSMAPARALEEAKRTQGAVRDAFRRPVSVTASASGVAVSGIEPIAQAGPPASASVTELGSVISAPRPPEAPDAG